MVNAQQTPEYSDARNAGHDDGVFHRLLIGVDALHDLEPKVTQRCGDQTGVIGRVGQRRLFIGALTDHERNMGAAA